MKRFLTYGLTACLLLIGTLNEVRAQDVYQKYGIYRSPIRVLINHVSWNISTGYGYTQYRHNLEGFWLYRDQGDVFVSAKPPGENTIPQFIQGYGNWINSPTLGPLVETEIITDVPIRYIPDPVNNPGLIGSPYADGDTTFYRADANSIPITLSAHVEFLNFKVGGGYTFERQWVNQFKVENRTDEAFNFTPNFSGVSFNRVFGMVGYRFYEFWEYAAVVDLQIGKLWYGNAFDPLATQGTVNINAGITLEHHWSEYFALTLRPSFDYKRYTLNLPDGSFILHQHNSLHLQFGVSIKIPEIPRTPLGADHVQLKHVITDPATGRLMEVRGQPFWKKQNPKVGENHRKLWRYKWRNKRKIHPY